MKMRFLSFLLEIIVPKNTEFLRARACAALSNSRVHVRARAQPLENFACACVRVRGLSKFWRARACACVRTCVRTCAVDRYFFDREINKIYIDIQICNFAELI